MCRQFSLIGRRLPLATCLAALLPLAVSVARADELTIVRDRFGVPHIFADTAEAAAYGVALAQCEDNLATVVYCLHAGVGRLAELLGPNYLKLDIQARILGHGYYARRHWPHLDPQLRRILQAYCDGVNDYLKAHPHELPYRVPPVEPVQVVAWHRKVLSAAAVAISRADAEASRPDGYQPPGRGAAGAGPAATIAPGHSNSWALAPTKTRAGVPMLLIDPHWPSSGPLQLYEAYLHGGRLQVGGFMLNGTPLPGIGLSPAAAWTVTAGGADSSDAYALKINPDNPHQYLFDGKWEDMTVRSETIRVRHGNSYREQVVEVLATRHGPVLKTKTGVPFAAAYAGWDRADVIEQTYRMAVASNRREFKAAMAMDRYSYFNLTWVTADGHIGYVQTGQVPRRPAGFNWQKILPGWTSRALHQGQVPFHQLPIVEDPPTGFLQNCNVAANEVTPGLTFTREDFPIGVLYGHYGAFRARGRRATQLLAQLSKATLEDARRVAFDTYVIAADLWVPVIVKAWQQRVEEKLGGPPQQKADEKLLAEAVELLEHWDRFARRQSCGATLFRFWRFECAAMPPPVGRDSFQVPDTPEVRRQALRALAQAARRLNQLYGSLRVPWGRVKRLRRGQKEWPLSGDGLGTLGLDTLRATAADTLDEEGKLIMGGGQCVTTLILMTRPPTVRSVVTYGQSNKPASPHYDDQAPLFSAERMRPVPWTREQLQSCIESERHLEYRPTSP